MINYSNELKKLYRVYFLQFYRICFASDCDILIFFKVGLIFEKLFCCELFHTTYFSPAFIPLRPENSSIHCIFPTILVTLSAF